MRLLLLGSVLACLVAGCGGNSVTTTTGPSAVKCATTLSGLPAAVPAGGARVQATVTAARECSWSATADASWVQLSPESGQGEGQVMVVIAANDTPAARSGAIIVNGARMSVNQQPAACRFDLDRASAQLGSDGGRAQVSIAT